MDCIVIHGGLGTTAEALRSGVPTIVTGTLLMDQRFWGVQMAELGIGPPPVHITSFSSCCVELVDRALQDNSKWKKNAQAIAKQLKLSAEEETDGVKKNVEMVVELSHNLLPFSSEIPQEDKRGIGISILG